MSHAQSFSERELWIEDDARKGLRQQIDPLIRNVLMARGYTEDRSSDDRIYLDGTAVLASKAYIDTLKDPYDALTVRTRYDVSDGERTLIGGGINLRKIGGFATAQLAMAGSQFFYGLSSQKTDQAKIPLTKISEDSFRDALEDIRAQTTLGYASSDTFATVSELFEDIDGLTSNRFIDRHTHLQLLTDEAHGDIQANVGETYEERDVIVNKRLQHRRRSRGKMFEFITKQPLDPGFVSMGIHYRSIPRTTEMKLSASLDGTVYSDEEQSAMYQEAIRSFQDPRFSRFGDAAIRNLKMASDPNADVIRIG